MRTAIHSAPRPWRRLAILLTAFVTFFAFGAPSALATSPPVATDNSYSVDEDAQLTGNVITDDTGSGVDSDANGDPLSAIVASEVSHGSLTLNTDGSFTYDPNANYNGSDSFTYTLSDGDGTTANDTATVSITVNAVNDAPVATDDSATTSEDTAVTVSVLDNDSDVDAGDTLSVIA
ncbi:MAG: cadherin-like domain-containing protein, partial [Halobacteriales archaeon]|nr:cadherin-like domain-containing protein [Halobacteriales archaeon]